MLEKVLDRVKKVLFLNSKVYGEIAQDRNANLEAILVVFISWIISSAATLFYEPRFLIILLFSSPVFWLVSAAVFHVLARFFGGNCNFPGYLRAVGYCHAPRIIGVIPVVGTIVGDVWALCCVVIATRETHKLSFFKSLIVVLIPVLFILALLLMFVLMVGITDQLGGFENQTLTDY